MDTDLLQSTLEAFFESDEGSELLDNERCHESYDLPEIEVTDLDWKADTNTATFTVTSTGTDLNSYEKGDHGKSGRIDADCAGACRYKFDLKIEDQRIDLNNLTCVKSEVISRVGDLR